jgi:hypothetical protein
MSRERDFGVVLDGPEQGHQQIVRAWEHEIKPRLQAGERLWLGVQKLEEARDLQRNREYWGFVLRPISEQTQAEGMGATADGWHDYYRLMFLGYEFTKVRLPGKKRPSVRRALRSTTRLSNREMREYMEQIRAHASTTWGVTFPIPPWAQDELDRNAGRKREVVNEETGEITEVPA